MGKISKWFGKWGFVIILCIFAVGLLFSLGCSIYTAAKGNLAVGIVGMVFNALCLTVLSYWIAAEINEG